MTPHTSIHATCGICGALNETTIRELRINKAIRRCRGCGFTLYDENWKLPDEMSLADERDMKCQICGNEFKGLYWKRSCPACYRKAQVNAAS